MSLAYTEHADAGGFLAAARVTLERQEAANNLMLGIGRRLVDEPEYYGSRAYLASVEAGGGLRAIAVMTPPFRLQVWTPDDPDYAAVGLVADALREGGWPVPGVMGNRPAAEAFAAAWRARTGRDWSVAQRMRIYELRRVEHLSHPAGFARPAGLEDLDLARRWARGFHDDCFDDGQYQRSVGGVEESAAAGRLYLWVDGEPRSMAARLRPTEHGETVSFVYTPPEQRGHGFASAVVAHTSQQILDAGKRFCTLYADLANPTSNAIYQRIGYRPVADVVELDFGEG